jgi:structural maintenance of chromosome 3 (chondroitin sulfate proteoglycan 6)
LPTAIEKEQDELQKKIKTASERHEKTRNEQVSDAREIERGEKSLQRYLSQKQIFTAKKDQENKNIRDLGVLPDEAFEKYLRTNNEKVSADRRGFFERGLTRSPPPPRRSSRACTRSATR